MGLPKTGMVDVIRTRAALRTVGLTLSLLALSSRHVLAQDRAAIPWRRDATFTRTSVDDDVRSVLRAVLAADDLSVVFRPGVEGKVSASFRGVALQAAFERLLAEGGLRAEFDPATRTVTVAPGGAMGGAAGAELHHFVPLGDVEWGSLRQMLVSFGLGTQGIAFDPATSLLAVTGDPARVSQVEDLVHTLQQHYGEQQERSLAETQRFTSVQRSDLERRAYQDALDTQTRVFRLRFADVGPTTRNFHGRSVTIPGILETLQAMLGTAGAPPPFATQAPAPTTFRPSIGGGTRGAPGAEAGAASAAPGPAGPMAGVGKPAISIDQRTNSVIVRGSPAAIAAVADVLAQLDQPVKMVEIEVIIATAELGVINQLGVAYRGNLGKGNGQGGFDTGTTGGQLTGALGQTPLNALTLLPATAAGGTVASFVVGGSGVNIQAQLQALAQQNKARVLSAPHLVTMDNITARITRAEDIYVPVDTGGLNGQGLSQIQTGLTLEITPSIVPAAAGGRDQLVRLTLDATNSAPGSGTGSQINVNSQEVQTDVLVPDGGTFVVGGLFDDSRLKAVSGIPVLKDIPLLGQLFRTDSSQQSLGQTIFFITPHVVDQGELVSRDVALGETAPYMDAQQRALRGMTHEMSGMPTPAAARLEEDE